MILPHLRARLGLAAALLLWLPAMPAPAQQMSYVWALSAGTSAELERYATAVLDAALERTRHPYGPYDVSVVTTMERKRIIHEIEHGSAVINAALFPLDQSLEETLLPVRIPVDRGILGLRILLVRAGDQDRLAAVHSVREMRELRIGVMPSWTEARVIRSNGLNATDGSSLDGLWKMLAHGRIDALDRSALEAGAELARYHAEFPDVVFDRHLALFSPLPSYFWFSRSDGGRRLADRVRVGLEAMLADGSLDLLFHQHFDPALRGLELESRSMIYLDNPDIGPIDLVADHRYWLFTKRE